MHEPSSTVADSSKLQAAESVHPPPSTSVKQDSVNVKAPPAESENTEFSIHVSKTLSDQILSLNLIIPGKLAFLQGHHWFEPQPFR